MDVVVHQMAVDEFNTSLLAQILYYLADSLSKLPI